MKKRASVSDYILSSPFDMLDEKTGEKLTDEKTKEDIEWWERAGFDED